jgi:hypothetical protein
MCYVAAVPVITLLLTAATTAYTIDQQNKNVKAQNKAMDIAEESAKESFRQQASTVNLRLQQEQEAATNAKIENAKRAAEARGTARASAGQAGVAGFSVDNLLADFYRQEAQYRSVTDTNLGYVQEQSRRDMAGLKAGTQSQINRLVREPIPGYLGAGLRIGAAGVGAYDDYKTNSDPNWKRR